MPHTLDPRNDRPTLTLPTHPLQAADAPQLDSQQELALQRLLARGEVFGETTVEMLRTSGRVLALTASRESSMSAKEQLADLLHMTLLDNLDLPGVEEVIAAGLAPLDAKNPPFPCIRFRWANLKAVLFAHEGVWHFVGLGSAAKVNDSTQENLYAAVMVDILEVLRPRRLAALNVARLLRSVKVGGQVRAAIDDHVDEVRIGGISLDVRNTMSGFAFATFAQLAAVERDMIVMRLTMGAIWKWRRGRWYSDDISAPHGYTLAEDKTLVVDPSQKETMAEMLRIIGEPDVEDAVMVRRLGRLGFKTRSRGYGANQNLALVTQANSAVMRFYKWVELWSTGTITVRRSIPLRTNGTFGGVEVIYDSPEAAAKGIGHVILPYKVDLPEGGWASEEVLAMAQLRAKERAEARKDGELVNDWKLRGRAAATTRGLFNGIKVKGPNSTPLRMRLYEARRDLLEFVGR